ncbi:MAG: aromatic ring-hydroxylating dioxygenase subunit alpha [Rhodococcus sp. (in: high G+C Gram-positive bacteria)]|nr:MAG: aromatic ring-hydroxylating dioxygenase subunit alpha [Rhodococcus sp. (in: high G+C Gram-positive bacteria)]
MTRVTADITRVSRRSYWGRDEFESEMERIFGRCWLFVAHESEIPSPGDYVTRKLGGEDVIVVRDETGDVRIFLNSCTHRGNQLCRADMGNSSHFRCSYHGWTFSNKGTLRGVPERKQVFDADFDKSEYNLVGPPNVDVFHGLIFASWDPDAPTLLDELGDMAWYLEAVLDKAGDLQVVGPPARALVRTNWKLGAENFAGDGYHLGTTHKSPIDLGTYLNTEAFPQLDDVSMDAMRGRCIVAGNGHTLRVQHYGLESDTPVFLGYPENRWSDIAAGLDPRQADLMSRMSVLHGNVFPNLSFIDAAALSSGDDTPAVSYVQFRQWQPVDEMHCELIMFALVPRWYDEQQREYSQRANLRMVGLAGIFDTDDFQNWTSIADMSRGRVSQSTDFVYAGGVGIKPADDVDWPGAVYDVDHSEVNQRAMFRRWSELLDDDSICTRTAGKAGRC